MRPFGLTGSKVEKACDEIHITLNKNTIIGDKSAVTPGGVRIGTPAVTTRGYKEKDMEKVGEFLDRVVRNSKELQERTGSKKLKDFVSELGKDDKMKELGKDVEAFAS